MSDSDDVWKKTSALNDDELVAAVLQASMQDRLWDATSALTDQELLAACINAEAPLPAETDGSANRTQALVPTLEVCDRMCLKK
jgi:hypothetical protein